jgi:hypothetical protein
MFIFVDALVYAVYPLPDRETSCGILVLPITNGTFPLIFGTALSILFMAAGTYLLHRHDVPAGRSRSLLFMVIATILAMTFGYLGWWLGALFVIIMSILTLLISAGNFFTSQTVR